MSTETRKRILPSVLFILAILFLWFHSRRPEEHPSYGFIDKHGKYVIQPRFYDAKPFSEGLAVVRTSKPGYGFIDKSGQVRIPMKYAEADDFSEGRASVSLAPIHTSPSFFRIFEPNDRSTYGYGYIDRNGKLVIPGHFLFSDKFIGGLASVTQREQSQRYSIDKAGECIKADKPWMSSTAQTLAPVESSLDYSWGYIDTHGKIVVPCQFGNADLFVNRFARVGKSMHSNSPEKWAFIDRSGKLLGGKWYDDTRDFSEGLAAVLVGDKWGFIDECGSMAIPPHFDTVVDFHEGLCPFAINVHGGYLTSNDFNDPKILWGYIDRKGSVMIKPKFHEVNGFSEGLAAVAAGIGDNQYGFIDRSGKYVIRPHFAYAHSFSEGLACVQEPFKNSQKPWYSLH